METNPLVFDRTPPTLNQNIIPSSSPSAHAQSAALVFHGIDRMAGFQDDGRLSRQEFAANPVSRAIATGTGTCYGLQT